MGFLEKMKLIEKVPSVENNIPDVDEEMTAYYGEEAPVKYRGDWTVDTLIDDIYAQDDLHDKTHSVFKIEELINSLPKEMVTETKRASVLSILGSFGLTADEVMSDGEKRISTLNSEKEKLNAECEAVILSDQNEIEENKKKIAELEANISENSEKMKRYNEVIETETKRILSLIEFMGGAE